MVEDAIRGLRPTLERTRVEVVGGFSRPPLVRTPAVARLYECAREVAAELGHSLAEGGTGGGSDGNFTRPSASQPSTGSARWATERTRSTSTSRRGRCRGAPPCWPG